jgi:multidrug efflux pump subunit AcrB
MNSAIAWFARNHVAANLLMVLLVVGGLAALPAIHQKSFPDFEIEMVQVGVPYPGAAPEEVEIAVCVRIEEEIQGIEGIDRIGSTASEGACGVTAELLSGYPVDRALSEIKNAVDGIDSFPEDAEKPIVSHVTVRREALQLALSGPASERALKVYGERLRDDISSLPGVTQVELSSTRDYEIAIEVPEESLRRHGLTFDQVAAAVRRGSLDRPGGTIRARDGEVLLRAKGQAYTGEEFERLVVVAREDGTRVLLGDVAEVRDGFSENSRYARFDGEPAVMIQVYRVGDQRVLDLVDRVKAFVDASSARIPAELSLTVWRDGAEYLRDRLQILVSNGRLGFVLVFVVLALFLRLRLAFWVAIGVPISFLAALAVFPVLDLSIDVISLFAFILVLGLLVDDAIVIGENVHRHQERDEEPLEASIRGAQEVAVPVIFGVLTTMAAFMPMMLSPGPLGSVFGAIGVVVVCCLFASLVESQLVLPAHLGRMRVAGPDVAPGASRSLRAKVAERWKRIQGACADGFERLARDGYRPALDRALEWRYATVAIGAALLMVTVTSLSAGHLRFSFFPPVENDYVSARLTMSLGTPVERTAAAVAELERSARRLQAELDAELGIEGGSVVKHVLAAIGEHPGGGPRPPGRLADSASAMHLGEVTIELMGADDRPLGADEVKDRWRALTPPLSDAEELVFASALFSVGDPIDLELKAVDIDLLRDAAEVLKAKLAEYPGVVDISDSFLEGKQEIQLAILPEAEALGLSLDDLARQVRQAFYGEEAQRIQRGRDDVKVMVRYPEAQRRSIADLENLRIRTPAGGEVPFYAVAKADKGRGYASIRRSDRQRVVRVSADVDRNLANTAQILRDLEEDFVPGLLAGHPGLSYTLEGEQSEQRDTLVALASNGVFALVLIYALLAVPLRSYTQPLIIMAVIPFGLVGAILGHMFMGLFGNITFNMMSVFGVVALSGVVVNASLVLVHYVNACRDRGQPLEEAIREAGGARFRPIVLTALTTFVGLAPLLAERTVAAQFLIPMATSLGFGVIVASGISLFLVPAGYAILEDLRLRRRRKPVLASVEPLRGDRRRAGGDFR